MVAAGRYLRGNRSGWARYGGGVWGDLTLKLQLRLLRGAVHLNCRVDGPRRHFVGLRSESEWVYLAKQTGPETFFNDLAVSERPVPSNRFITVEVTCQGSQVQVRVDGVRVLQYEDRTPLGPGGISFETVEETSVYLDDVLVTSLEETGAGPTTNPEPGAGPGLVVAYARLA